MNTTSDGHISSNELIDEGLSLITKKKQSILCNKPTIVVASILELSKLFMLNFHYNVMKKKQCQLLYSDRFFCVKKQLIFIIIWKSIQPREHTLIFPIFPGITSCLINRKTGAKIQGRASRNPH